MTDPHAVHSPADVPDLLTVVEFLRARLDEDEAVALPFRNQAGVTERWRCAEVGGKVHQVGPPEFGLPDVISESDTHLTAAHIARWDPARVLREIAAKRRIVDLHDGPHECSSHGDNCTWIDGDLRPHCDTLALLAVVYDQHPGYNERWRP